MSVLIKLEIKYAIYQWSTEDLLILKKKVYIFGLSGLLNIVKAIFFLIFKELFWSVAWNYVYNIFK